MSKRPEKFVILQAILADIQGWLVDEAAAAWDCFLEFQNRNNINGNFLEIGVWRGKTAAILKYHHDPNEEKVILVDKVLQTKFIDEALAKVPVSSTEVFYHEIDSHDLFTKADIEIEPGTVRWVHIDGEHTGHAVMADLRVADKYLSQEGIVCVDDFCDPQYVQVTEAVFRYIEYNRDRLCLFNCGFKKAYLARPSFVNHYLMYCYDDLIDDLEARGAMVTISKTTSSADLNCFSMVPRYNNWRLRGPDWDKNYMEMNRYLPLNDKNRKSFADDTSSQ